MGHVFLLNRETGEPLYPIEERPVPQGGAGGDAVSDSAVPDASEAAASLNLSPDDAFGFSFLDRNYCRELIEANRYEGIFTPHDTKGTIQTPHTSGGMNWGGVTIDEKRGIMVVVQTHAAVINRLIPRAEAEGLNESDFVFPNEFYEMKGAPYAVHRRLLAPSSAHPAIHRRGAA